MRYHHENISLDLISKVNWKTWHQNNPYWHLSLSNFKDESKSFIGHVNEDEGKFIIRRVRNFPRYWIPQIHISGLILEKKLQIKPIPGKFTIGWYSFILLGAIRTIISIISSEEFAEVFWVGLIWFAIFFIGTIWLSIYEYQKLKQGLFEILEIDLNDL